MGESLFTFAAIC